MGFFKRAWRGEVRLWIVFWMCAVLGQIIFLPLAIAPLALLLSFAPMLVMTTVIILFVLSYYVWLTVSLWRCSRNTKWKGWGVIVRILIMLNVILFIMVAAHKLNEEIRPGSPIPVISTVGAIWDKKENDKGALDAYSDSLKQKFDETSRSLEEPVAREVPVMPPVSGAESGTPSPAMLELYIRSCEGRLLANAVDKGMSDPKAYVLKNRNWVMQCAAATQKQGAATQPAGAQ